MLPANWTYVAERDASPGGAVEPADRGREHATWTNVGDLAPGQSVVRDFAAPPLTRLRRRPRRRAARQHARPRRRERRPQQRRGGPYKRRGHRDGDAAGSRSDDRARRPTTATPTPATVRSWTRRIAEHRERRGAQRRIVDVLPAGRPLRPGRRPRGVRPPASREVVGHARSASGQTTVVWSVAALAAGAPSTVTVPVMVDADVADGHTLTNTASVRPPTSCRTRRPTTARSTSPRPADVAIVKTPRTRPSSRPAPTSTTRSSSPTTGRPTRRTWPSATRSPRAPRSSRPTRRAAPTPRSPVCLRAGHAAARAEPTSSVVRVRVDSGATATVDNTATVHVRRPTPTPANNSSHDHADRHRPRT